MEEKRNSQENGVPKGHNAEDSYKQFQSAAVVCNNSISCTVGKNILAEGGSVVDAAIASMLTIGVISFQSAGIGGGFIMVYYDAETKQDYVLDARTVAPLAAYQDMYNVERYHRTYGRLSIAIPGEIRGYWEAHVRFGKLPWSRLFEPAIQAAEDGFGMTSSCENWMNIMFAKVGENNNLRNLLKKADGNFKRAGDIIKRPNYAETLRIIAKEGCEAFYNGSLTKSILEDINDGFGLPSIITKEDFTGYRVKMEKSIKINLDDNHQLITTPAPSGGPVLAFMLNILKGYKFTSKDLSEDKILTYHRIVEAMKFAYYERNHLGDPDFSIKVEEVVQNMVSEEHAREIRKRIDDTQTHLIEYYGESLLPLPEDHGTAQLGIIGKDGSAIAMTSTVNNAFGSSMYGKRTGILFNDQMALFSVPQADNPNTYRLQNLLAPGKRCVTATCPSIIMEKTPNGSEVKMVIGGSGGSRIINSSLIVIMRTLWFNKNINEAVNEKRFHHSWYPNVLRFQEGFNKEIIHGLKNKGHEIETEGSHVSTVQAIMRQNENIIAAKCDDRRGGSPDGF
ncbi:glutathione hydrolase 1 proenzyme-like [Styela clava]